MAVRTIKSLNKSGQTSRRKARAVAKAIRQERSASLARVGTRVVITRASTATGAKQIAFYAAKARARGHG